MSPEQFVWRSVSDTEFLYCRVADGEPDETIAQVSTRDDSEPFGGWHWQILGTDSASGHTGSREVAQAAAENYLLLLERVAGR